MLVVFVLKVLEQVWLMFPPFVGSDITCKPQFWFTSDFLLSHLQMTQEVLLFRIAMCHAHVDTTT